MRALRVVTVGAILGIACIVDVHAQSSIPDWARARWETIAKSRVLQQSLHVKANTLTGDFDGDGKPDLAMIVENRTTHKIGIVFIHHDATAPRLIGAGTEFGNGGDNFDWMDNWHIERPTRTRHTDAIVIERESSASALIYFGAGKYHWKQLGD